MLLFVASALTNSCSEFFDLLSLPVEDRKSIENTILTAEYLNKSIFSRAQILEPHLEKNLREMMVAWKQRQFLMVAPSN